ncbi:MAG: peptide chain release factor N(5)-glutamine methyltransferase [Flavobacterium sp.]|nr:MAG: peptide chain release factor N(5)-glutamine methyltransferase [Flavobacterium sp.]
MQLAELKNYFESELANYYPSEEAQSFFILLSEAWLDYSRMDVSLNASEVIPSELISKYKNALERLQLNEPIQYIIGSTEFYGLPLVVSPDTLIPRPETEELVRWILEYDRKKVKILDVGTGSGCIAIALARMMPEAEVTAMDISDKALEIARKNADLNQVKVSFLQTDILAVHALPEQYDLIVSNPPYVREQEKSYMHDNVLLYEPDTALFVSESDPLIFYRAICRLALRHLKQDGLLFFEINEYLSKEMESLLKEEGFQNIEVGVDFRGKDRFLRCTL